MPPLDETETAAWQAMRRNGRKRVATFLAISAVGGIVWWFACQWLRRGDALDASATRTGTLLAVTLAVMAVFTITDRLRFRRLAPSLSPRLQSLARERSDQATNTARPWRIAALCP